MEHYCQEHKTDFFKKGRMKDYAHLIGDTGKWCNEFKKAPPTTGLGTGQTREEVIGEETPSPKTGAKSDPRNRSMCLSYAKDLACAGKITVEQITTYANKFLEYLC